MAPLRVPAAPQTGLTEENAGAREAFGEALFKQEHYRAAAEIFDALLAAPFNGPWRLRAAYNAGLSHEREGNFETAVDRYRALIEEFKDTPLALDAAFRIGYCYESADRWPQAAIHFRWLAELPQLGFSAWLQAQVQLGFALFKQGEPEQGGQVLRQALLRARQTTDPLESQFDLAQGHYLLGEIAHRYFMNLALELPENVLEERLEQKAQLLLNAQRHYLDTLRAGDDYWATAAGFALGSLYEELWQALLNAPVPGDLAADEQEVYRQRLRERVRTLLSKAFRIYEKNMLMAERLGADTEFVAKTRGRMAWLKNYFTQDGAVLQEGH